MLTSSSADIASSRLSSAIFERRIATSETTALLRAALSNAFRSSPSDAGISCHFSTRTKSCGFTCHHAARLGHHPARPKAETNLSSTYLFGPIAVDGPQDSFNVHLLVVQAQSLFARKKVKA